MCYPNSVQFSGSVMSDSLPPHGLQQASLSITNFWSLLKLMSTELVMSSDQVILCQPSSCLPYFPASGNESVLLIRWPEYWSFSFSISPSNEYSGLISLRIDLFGLLAVQGTLKSLLQHHNLKASIFWRSVFFVVQLSHLCMTTGKNHSFDYTHLCQQSHCFLRRLKSLCLCFLIHCLGLS